MREKKHFSMTAVISGFAFVVLMMGLAGCSTDRTQSTSNANAISAPVDMPESFSIMTPPRAFIIGGVDPQMGHPDLSLDYQVTVLLNNNEPVPFPVLVELRWTAANYPNRDICVTGQGTTLTIVNGTYKLQAYTDENGVAHFTAAGGYTGSIACSGGDPTARLGRLYVNGDEQTPPPGGWFLVATADLNYTSGVDSADQSLAWSDVFCGNYFSRSDYNGDLDVTAADLSILQSIVSGGGSDASACE